MEDAKTIYSEDGVRLTRDDFYYELIIENLGFAFNRKDFLEKYSQIDREQLKNTLSQVYKDYLPGLLTNSILEKIAIAISFAEEQSKTQSR